MYNLIVKKLNLSKLRISASIYVLILFFQILLGCKEEKKNPKVKQKYINVGNFFSISEESYQDYTNYLKNPPIRAQEKKNDRNFFSAMSEYSYYTSSKNNYFSSLKLKTRQKTSNIYLTLKPKDVNGKTYFPFYINETGKNIDIEELKNKSGYLYNEDDRVYFIENYSSFLNRFKKLSCEEFEMLLSSKFNLDNIADYLDNQSQVLILKAACEKKILRYRFPELNSCCDSINTAYQDLLNIEQKLFSFEDSGNSDIDFVKFKKKFYWKDINDTLYKYTITKSLFERTELINQPSPEMELVVGERVGIIHLTYNDYHYNNQSREYDKVSNYLLLIPSRINLLVK